MFDIAVNMKQPLTNISFIYTKLIVYITTLHAYTFNKYLPRPRCSYHLHIDGARAISSAAARGVALCFCNDSVFATTLCYLIIHQFVSATELVFTLMVNDVVAAQLDLPNVSVLAAARPADHVGIRIRNTSAAPEEERWDMSAATFYPPWERPSFLVETNYQYQHQYDGFVHCRLLSRFA